jgi:PAS domain S-box-containing protein
MNGFGVFGIVAGVLQLVVPSYALRLVRRFGTTQVGWFIVASFALLALLHILGPSRMLNSGAALNLLLTAASMLLLVGMCHLETLLTQREELHAAQELARHNTEADLRRETAELSRTNEQLFNDVACLRTSLEIAQQSETTMRLLFEQNPQAMWIFDLRSLKFLAANQAALKHHQLSAEAALNQTVRELLKPEAIAAFLRDVARPCGTPEFRGVWQLRRADGTQIDAEITALDLRYADCPARLILTTDVTQRRRRELKVRESLKAELLGQVAEGVSGTFNEIFSHIDYQSSLLLQQFNPPATLNRLQELSASTSRGLVLTERLRETSGRGELPMEIVQLGALIGKHEPVLRQVAGPRVELRHTWEPDLPMILADSSRLQRILTELVLNAREAMPQGGTIRLASTSERFEESQLPTHPDARSGEFVCLAVSDNGCGMVPETRARLFEPFFTTKPGNRRPGLGLASIKGIVRQHRGWIEYSTELDGGTEFRLYFPVAPRTAVAMQSPPTELRRTVLLIEANDRLRTMARFTLERKGYRVVETDSAETARMLWDKQAAQTDLLLCGLSPAGDSSGPELAAQLRQTRPQLRAVFFTQPDSPTAPADTPCIPTLCTPEQIISAVQEAFEKRPAVPTA